MFVRYLTLGILIGGLQMAPAEVIQLKEKALVAGKVLAEKRDQVIIDLGFTVLTIPRNQIVRISKEELPDTKAKTKPELKPVVATVSESVSDLYQSGKASLSQKTA